MPSCTRCGRLIGHAPHDCPAEQPLPTLKRCCDCRRELPVAAFHRALSKWGGRLRRASRCRECQSAYARRWRKSNAAAHRVKKREYASEHPWEYRAWRMNHRARKLQPSCVGEVTGAELEAIWGTGVCAYCARAAGTFDHVVPLQRGGDNTAANLLACCKSCNATKKDLMPAEWEKKRQVHHAAPTASQTA